MSSLQPAIHGYGIPKHRQQRGEKSFSHAYSKYAQEILDNIHAWCEERTAAIMDQERELIEHLHILDSLPDRMEAILANDLFLGSDFGMDLPTNAPLLCSYFLTDITGFLSMHVGSVLEVFRMLDPFYCDAINAKGSLDAYTLLVNWILRENPKVDTKKVIYKVPIRFRNGIQQTHHVPPRSSLWSSNIGLTA